MRAYLHRPPKASRLANLEGADEQTVFGFALLHAPCSRRSLLLSLAGIALAACSPALPATERPSAPSATAARRQTHHLLIYRGHINTVLAVAWSPDGLLLLSSSADETVRVWTVTSGATLVIHPPHDSRWGQGGLVA